MVQQQLVLGSTLSIIPYLLKGVNPVEVVAYRANKLIGPMPDVLSENQKSG